MDKKELVDNFALFDDWEDRYAYLIDLAKQLPPMDDALKTSATRVEGCLSQVWIMLSWDDDNRLRIMADGEAQIVRGLMAVLFILFSEKTKKEASEVNIEEIFTQLGFDEHLSPNRRNGFFSMVERIQHFIR